MPPLPSDGPASRFQRLRQLFEAAKERPPADRDAFVRRLAGADTSLAEEVLAMLRADAEDKTTDLQAAGRAGLADAAHGFNADETPPTDGVQSTATAELLQKLAQAPKLDTNRYQLEGEVDRGGMGAILRIRDDHLNRRLAMKVLLPRQAPQDDDEQKLAHQILGRFLEEAQVTSQLDHPGVVPVHELGLDQNGKVYFTMRLVKGKTAGEIFHMARAEEDGWTPTRALDVILKVCDTMSYAHDKGVLHRDLKPGNVMVGKFGEVYVMDWGLAKVLGQADRHAAGGAEVDAAEESRIETARRRDADEDGDGSMVTGRHHTLGTPSYMAPEQARREVLDARVDVYAIGAMLYQLLTGQAPYVTPGVKQFAGDIVKAVREGPPKRIEHLAKDTPAELVAIAEKAMQRDREQRYASAVELAADLRAFLDQRSVKAYRTGALVELKLWVRRNKPLAASLAAAALILVGGVVVSMTLAKQKAVLAEEKTALATKETQAKDEALREKQRADDKTREALNEKGRADAKVNEFNQLSGVVLYERAIENEKDLYPPWPHKVEAMERWLKDDAGMLLAMQPEIEKTVRDLEARALPPTAEQLEADRRSHPRFAELEPLSRRVASLAYAQRIRSGQEALMVPALNKEQQDLDLEELNLRGWERVSPKPIERKVHGEEALGLAYLRLAVAKAQGTPFAFEVHEALAWALLANGQDAEAKAQGATAADNAPITKKDDYHRFLRDIEATIDRCASSLATAEQQLAELTNAVDARRTFTFEVESQHFLHDTLVGLLNKLGSLAAKEKVEVEKRLVWAKQIQELSLHHPNRRHEWSDVRAAIASNPKYAGQTIELRDQDITGLVPIGENPTTHLWDFYDLRSAWDGTQDPKAIAIPNHATDGTIAVTDNTGIVFVLLPGGTFTMGAQKQDHDRMNFDPAAERNEAAHELTLAPFFLARHELTQGQWQRLWDGDPTKRLPSNFKAGNKDGRGGSITQHNPVELVNWTMCNTLLSHAGLVLPTEAQWEYGCRAGTSTPWWPGREAMDLDGVDNLRDMTAARFAPQWGPSEPFDDKHLVHAPVGSFPANGFGLHDVHGNVSEWCRDEFGSYDGPVREGDGLRLLRQDSHPGRCTRGGSFCGRADLARASARTTQSPTFQTFDLGLRAARSLSH